MTDKATDKKPGVLYLVPCVLAEGAEQTIPEYVKRQVEELNFFVVENARSARRFLRSIGYKKNFDEVTLVEMDKHHPLNWNRSVLKYLQAGGDAGVISEAGLPAIADPGNVYVKAAHENSIRVVPMIGPSSILLALIASGLNGQRFCFHGYLPVDKMERAAKIKEMEAAIDKDDETQIFMETPYRNQNLLKDILEVARMYGQLCIAVDLTAPTEFIKTQTIKEWRRNVPDINKRPAVFLLYK